MSEIDVKLCARCKVTRPLDDFSLAPRMKLGRQSYCRPCKAAHARERYPFSAEKNRARRREYHRLHYTTEWRRGVALRKYDLAPEAYAEMAAQGCAICHTPEPGGKSGAWHIDHDHATGKVRGLLCANCNVGLGMFGDSQAKLWDALRYLIGHAA